MTESTSAWVEQVRRIAGGAPEWMRERASIELHIGGFTQARIEAPLLDVADLGDGDRAARAATFFLVVAAASDARVARIHLGAPAWSAAGLIGVVRRTLGGAADRIDAENVSLLRYFDVYLKPPADVGADEGARLANALAIALEVAAA